MRISKLLTPRGVPRSGLGSVTGVPDRPDCPCGSNKEFVSQSVSSRSPRARSSKPAPLSCTVSKDGSAPLGSLAEEADSLTFSQGVNNKE